MQVYKVQFHLPSSKYNIDMFRSTQLKFFTQLDVFESLQILRSNVCLLQVMIHLS